ncbi:hypothetical protein [Chamaesiphon polymorphus]|uniref:hypothetical protein n=1 Tax=Chamaesiphon polymorphus TaxID=2107691 RepID=UPI001C635DBC|nr:hypothetical protein [Chamaesiphon polymorphus]
MINARILPEVVEDKIAMSWDIVGWLGANLKCPIACCAIGWRFLRYKFHPWMTLATSPLNILTKSGIDRTHAQNRYLSAIGKINFVNVYALLDNLLW